MTTTGSANQRILPGLGLRVIAIALMTGMIVLVRLADDQGAHVVESLFFRLLFGFLFIFAWMRAQRQLKHIKTERPDMHFSRAMLGITSMGLNLWAYTEMPMAEAATISFTVPIFATLLSIFFLAEVVGIGRWIATIIGFVGILIVVQPGQNILPLKGVIIGLSGATFAAMNVIAMRLLGRTERSSTMVFWYTAYSFPVVGLAYYFVAKQHAPMVWLLFIGIGLLGAAGQLALSQSLRWAPVSVVMPMDYTHLIWSILLGLAIWGERPVITTWLGAAIITASGIYVALREHHSTKAGILLKRLESNED